MSSSAISEQGGALPPPKGLTPNFSDPENRNASIYAVVAICVLIITALVFARTYTRFVLSKSRGWQDYLLLIAWLLAVVYMIMMPMGIKYGAGIHQWNVTKTKYEEFAKRANIADTFYSPVICMVKLAILVQLASIFAPTRDGMYWTIYGLSVLTVLFYFACMMFRILACIPREKIWHPWLAGKCINSAAGILASAVLNTISDFVLLALPLSGIWRLQISRRKKWQVSAVFATGLFGCVSSIMRLIASANLLKDRDLTYRLVTVGLWCDAEITSAIVCCCLPLLPKLYKSNASDFLKSIRPRFLSSGTSGSRMDGAFSKPNSSRNLPNNGVHGPPSYNRDQYQELDDVDGNKETTSKVERVPDFV